MKYYISPQESINKTLLSLKKGDILFLKEGIYKEKIKISMSNITIIGENRDKTIIVNDDYSTKIHKDNKEYNTFRTYTMMVLGDNIKISNLTIKNEANLSNLYGQAVALHILGDEVSVESCAILGAQDTLLCGPIPDDLVIRYQNFLPEDELKANKPAKQVFNKCFIEGDVDYIFGGGTAIFNECVLNSLDNLKTGYIAAPSHSQNKKYGFVFIDCKITGPNNKTVFLARPWRDYGKAVYINCDMGNVINDLGWNNWGNSNRDKTCYFAEYSTNINVDKRVSFAHFLTLEELEDYVLEKISK